MFDKQVLDLLREDVLAAGDVMSSSRPSTNNNPSSSKWPISPLDM